MHCAIRPTAIPAIAIIARHVRATAVSTQAAHAAPLAGVDRHRFHPRDRVAAGTLDAGAWRRVQRRDLAVAARAAAGDRTQPRIVLSRTRSAATRSPAP